MGAGNEYAGTKSPMRSLISHSLGVPASKIIYKSLDECQPSYFAVCFSTLQFISVVYLVSQQFSFGKCLSKQLHLFVCVLLLDVERKITHRVSYYNLHSSRRTAKSFFYRRVVKLRCVLKSISCMIFRVYRVSILFVNGIELNLVLLLIHDLYVNYSCYFQQQQSL